MKIRFLMKNGVTQIVDADKIDMINLNPCTKCRPQGGCYDHSCFAPEDWGHFLEMNNISIKAEDIQSVQIIEL